MAARLEDAPLLDLGLVHYHAHRFALADEAFGRAVAGARVPAWVRFRRARIAERSGRPDDALDELGAYDASAGAAPFAALLEAASHDRLRRARARRLALERAAVRVDAEPARLFEIPGPGPEGIDAAIERLRRAVAERPSYPDRRCLLAGQLLANGAAEEARLHALTALAMAPGSASAGALAGRAALSAGECEEASERFATALASHDEFPDLWLWLALGRWAAGDLLGAQRAATASLARNPEHGAAYRLLALILFRAGDETRASLALKRGMARGREPHAASPAAACASAGCAAAEDEAPLRVAITQHPEYPDLRLALARVLTAVGRSGEAATEGRSALQADPHFDTAVLEMALLELGRGRRDEAVRLLLALVRRRPGWADAQGLLGRVLAECGDREGAVAALRAALGINPALEPARTDLVRLVAESPVGPIQAGVGV